MTRLAAAAFLVMAVAACSRGGSAGATHAGTGGAAGAGGGGTTTSMGAGGTTSTGTGGAAGAGGASAPPMRIEAWIFPGDPACNAPAEYSDGRHIDVLKPEYFHVDASGALVQLTVATDGCNAFSAQNAADVKAHSARQLVTVSADAPSEGALVADPAKRAAAIATLVAFVDEVGFSGVDIDFEGTWTAAEYAGYLTFLQELGDALHAKGLFLEIDTTAFASAADQATQLFKYEDVAPLPVDWIVVMAYDYMTDDGPGAGAPIAPNTWVASVMDWTFAKVGDPSRVVVGIPSYGYSGKVGSYDVDRAPYDHFDGLPGFSTATGLPDAYEMSWTSGGTSYVYVDAPGLDQKRAFVAEHGAVALSVWHLGGNQWFTH